MDVADMLIDKIFKWVKLQKEGAEKFDKLATELEETKKGCNISKVVGSSVSVGGAAAMTVSGIAALVTGGAAIPFLFAAGAVASGLGLATNVTSDVVDITVASLNMKEAKQIGEKIENLEKEIAELMEKLKEEGERREKEAEEELSSEDYVVEKIVRAMAKREGLKLNPSISLQSMLSGVSKTLIRNKEADFARLVISLVSKIVMIAARKSGKSLVLKGLPKLAASMGARAAGKAVGRVGAGVVGLAFSVPELVINCIDVNNCKTEASQSLRKNAVDIRNASDQMENNLKNIQENIKTHVEVSQKTRSSEEKDRLMKLAETNCSNPVVLKWLRENSLTKLAEMFNFFKKHIDEEEKKNHSDTVDITFMAHGSIGDFMIPASCLLPLASIRDVVLYAPWNCVTSGLAYAIATGRLKPQHRVFYCSKKDGCTVPDEKHRPVKLPDHWNSMKKAGDQKIPNISVSPLRPGDGVWKYFESLTKQHGPVGRNRIIIPFILPEGKSESVPFSVVTLALSLVLLQSRFKATVHLNACLTDQSIVQKFDKEYLERQYAYAVDGTGMKGSDDVISM